MAELMLINPRKRKRRRKMSAKQNMYFGKRRKKRNLGTALMATNPSRRRSYSVSRSRKRYRRNPIGGGFKPMTFVTQTLMPSAIGAAGALGLDIVMGFLPLPATLKTGPMRPLIRIAGAVGIGMIAGMVTNKRMGEQVGAGALTVVLYDTLKGFVAKTMPTLTLGDIENDYPSIEYLSPAPQVDNMSAYVGTDYSPVGEYVEGY